jgi:hypothetical protein
MASAVSKLHITGSPGACTVSAEVDATGSPPLRGKFKEDCSLAGNRETEPSPS